MTRSYSWLSPFSRNDCPEWLLSPACQVTSVPTPTSTSPFPAADLRNHLLCFPGLRGADHGAAGLDDAGLLGGDLGQGVAQHLGVVQADGGDGADRRVDDVGGVEPPAQPGLQHLEVHGSLLEVGEGQGGQ